MAVLVIKLPRMEADGSQSVVQIMVQGIAVPELDAVTVDVRDRDAVLNVWTPIALTNGSFKVQYVTDWRGPGE